MTEQLQSSDRAIVLYPSPGMGHLVSMMELAKVLLSRGFSIRVVILDPPYNTGSTAEFIARVSAAHPSICFHHLPQVSASHVRTTNQDAVGFELIRLSNPNLLRYLQSAPALALVLDAYCLFSLDVARQLRLPAYHFMTSSASSLAAFMHFPSLHESTERSFRDMGETPIDFPAGIPKIPANHMPVPVLDRNEAVYDGFLQLSQLLTEPDGTIINTFEELESAAVKAIREGLCAPPGARPQPIYCLGPLITSEDRDAKERRPECLVWLDSQPRASVVFLCFGSLGRLSAEQLKEMATGLENSGQRFLWVVRSPPSDDPSKRFENPPEPDLDVLLPAGFLERTKDRGMVMKSWAPQASVLAHESIGGFVTHMGWNSMLEAVCAGVPMVGWPLYAEQRMNKVFMVDEQHLAAVMEGYDRDLVTASEVEARVRWLMESEGGQALRTRVTASKEAAVAALKEGGSSHKALDALVTKLRGV